MKNYAISSLIGLILGGAAIWFLELTSPLNQGAIGLLLIFSTGLVNLFFLFVIKVIEILNSKKSNNVIK